MQSLEALDDQLELLQDFLLIVVPLIMLLAGLGGWVLARRSLAPVLAMSERASRISADKLDQRLEVVNPRDELGRLAATFNDLLERLGKSFAQQRQFMADASHELRTPLSAIRTAAAVTLQRLERDPGEYREALAIVEQEARRLTRIVEDMFLLARADAGHPSLQNTRFYLDELLAESARAAAVLASQKKVVFDAAPLVEAPFFGDEALLRQMMWNLLDNALKHTPEGGRVGVALESHDSHYVITVTDSGRGIPAEIQPRIFERFYRADEARVRTETAVESGAGLGLPIARWIAEVHGGRLELRRSDPTGSTFVVHLPQTN
jgi:two-component system OmpR family sensor kinase